VVGLECERPEQCQDPHAGEVRQQQQTEGDPLQKHVPEDIVGRSADQRTYVREAQPTLDQAIRTAEASHKPVWRGGGSVSIAAFSPDGRLVLTTPSDKTARVFEAATDKEIDAPGSKQSLESGAATSVTRCSDFRGDDCQFNVHGTHR
jgi:WD40 repeat protein